LAVAGFFFLEAARGHGGVPMRMPLVTIGFSGSLGMAFLLMVMWARPARLGFLAGDALGAQVHQHHVALVPPLTMRRPRSVSVSATTGRSSPPVAGRP
jgi:hypothetical protein